MATLHYAKANFKTAYLQREIPVDVKLAESSGTLDLHVGDVVSISGNIVAPVTDSTNAEAKVEVGNYIIAQSDMTMGYGHVPVENRDYKYDDKVSLSDAKTNKVAFYRINTLDDVTLTHRDVTTA